jgi:anti-sigma factor (TIGR02949 family)
MGNLGGMTCEEAMRSLAAYLDNELAASAHQSVRQHLELCRSCYSRAEFERRLKSELRKLGKDDVPVGLEQRIRRLLQSFTLSADTVPKHH